MTKMKMLYQEEHNPTNWPEIFVNISWLGCIICVIGFVAYWGHYQYKHPEYCSKPASSIITSLGGCDRGGYCGFMTADGWTHTRQYPVIGQHIEYCQEHSRR